MSGGTPARRAARTRGRWAESAAALWLRLKGYRIVARGFSWRGGEIDVIVRRGRALAFVEVKYRADAGSAAEAITVAKRARIAGTARAWIAAHPDMAALALRFDAVLVTPWRLPVHLVDAWRE